MRNVIFDLTSEENVSRYCFAGFEGEHNATLLQVHLPSRMCLNGAEYRFLFETAKGEAVFSAPVSLVDGSVSVLLPRALMVAPRLKAYVGCYQKEGGETRLILKSGEMLLGVQKSGAEGEELDLGAGELPGLVLEDSVLPDSKNPVKSAVLYTALGEKVGKTDLSQSIPEQEKAKRDRAVSEAAVAGALDLYLKKEEYGADERVRAELVSNALKGKKSGNTLGFSDVSPLPHEIKVKLTGKPKYTQIHPAGASYFEFKSGDGVYTPIIKEYYEGEGWYYEFEDESWLSETEVNTDEIHVIGGEPYYISSFGNVSGAVVQKLGINLFDQETEFENYGFTKLEDGSWLGNSIHKEYALVIPYPKKGAMYIRYEGKSTGVANAGPNFYARFHYADGGQGGALALQINETDFVVKELASALDRTVDRIIISNSTSVPESFVIKNFMVSYVKCDYEPYTGTHETLTSDENGNISTVSNGESMTLIGEDGVTMEAEYNRDINKAFAELMEKVGGNA